MATTALPTVNSLVNSVGHIAVAHVVHQAIHCFTVGSDSDSWVLHPLEIPSDPWEMISMELITKLEPVKMPSSGC